MVYFGILQAMGAMLLAVAGVLLLYARKFYKLKDVVLISIQDVGEIMSLLANYNNLENPEQHLARLAKMTTEEVRLEIGRGNIIGIVSIVAGNVLRNLKQSVPESDSVMKKIEARLKI